jgi:hypothetical protein
MKVEIRNKYGGIQYSSEYSGLYLLREGTATKSSGSKWVSVACAADEIVAVQLQQNKPVANMYWKNNREYYALNTDVHGNSNSLKYRVYGEVKNTQIPKRTGMGITIYDSITQNEIYNSRAYQASIHSVIPVTTTTSSIQRTASFPFSSYVVLPKKGARIEDDDGRFFAQFIMKTSDTSLNFFTYPIQHGSREDIARTAYPENDMMILND